MRYVVYADTLVLLNTVVTYLLLLSVREFSGVKTSHRRLIAASFLGGAVSCVLLLPEMSVFVTLAVRAASGALIVFCAFYEGNGKRFIRCWALFAGMTFCYGGAMYGLSLVFPGTVRYRNGAGYLRIGFRGVVILLTAVYLLIRLLKRRFGKSEEQFSYEIVLTRNGKSVSGKAYLDSGNFVTDCYTGKPVVIATERLLSGLLSEPELEELRAAGGFREQDRPGSLKPRLIPVKTLGGLRLLPAFTCDAVTVRNGDRSIRLERATAAAGEDFGGIRYEALIGSYFLR